MRRRHFLAASAFAAACHATSAAEAGRRVRVGVIGHSGRGEYGHGLDTMWLSVPETEVVAFADADEKGRAKEQGKLKEAKAFADYRQKLAEMKPEIPVSIFCMRLCVFFYLFLFFLDILLDFFSSS